MGKKSQEAPADGLSDVFKTLFTADNPFRRKPEPQPPPPPPPPPQQQVGLGHSVWGVDAAGAGTPREGSSHSGEDMDGDGGAKKRKKPNVESEWSASEVGNKKRKSKESEEVVAEGPGKRRKKRKRGELEEEYETSKLGSVEDHRKDAEGGEEGGGRVGLAVGQKRKEMDDGKEMLVEQESFDDENKLLRTVFVGNLPLKTKRKALLKEFRKFGDVESIRIRSVPIVDSKIPRKGAIIKGKLNDAVGSVHAYIVFNDEQSAQAALALNMEKFGGNHIRVDMACPPRKKLKEETPLYNIKRTVFVGNLPFDVKDEELYQLFCKDNQLESSVEAVRVVRDPNTSLGKGIAYVLFKTREAANSVVRRKDLNLRGRDLRLSHARSDSTPSTITPSKRNSPGQKRTDFPNKRLETSSGKLLAGKSDKPSKAGSLSYQGLRASKSGVQKKARRAGGRLNPDGREKFSTRTSGIEDQTVLKQKRPAVVARKAKALRQAGMKRKQEATTPENSHQNKKARHLR